MQEKILRVQMLPAIIFTGWLSSNDYHRLTWWILLLNKFFS